MVKNLFINFCAQGLDIFFINLPVKIHLCPGQVEGKLPKETAIEILIMKF